MATIYQSPLDLDATKRGLGSAWGWIVGLGVVLIALGVIAFLNLPTATMVSVYAIGILMLIGAIAQLAAAFVVRSWGGIGLVLSALLYGAAGVLTFTNPTLAATAMTLALALSLIFSGASRVVWSIAMRSLRGWGWITASGIVSIAAGIVFIAGWPADSVWLLGMVLALDLTFQGATAIGWGLALKSL